MYLCVGLGLLFENDDVSDDDVSAVSVKVQNGQTNQCKAVFLDHINLESIIFQSKSGLFEIATNERFTPPARTPIPIEDLFEIFVQGRYWKQN